MNKYHNWVKVSVDELNRDFRIGAFKPQKESDLKCHLYHTLLQTKWKIKDLTLDHILLSEFPFHASGEWFDLVIRREKKDETRLIVEVKETSQRHLTANEVDQKINDDVDKLKRYKKTLEKEELKNYKDPIVFFFFRGADKHGISTETEREMENVKKKLELDGIVLIWGPK